MNKKVALTDRESFAAVLIFTGGFLNCYSFVLRGGVLAMVQTGNLLQFAYYVSDGQWERSLCFLTPLFCFLSGTFLTKYAFDFWCKKKDVNWKLAIMLVETVVFFLIGLFHRQLPDLAANSLIAFCASMQYCAFRKFGATDAVYATIFCTGSAERMTDGRNLSWQKEITKN